MEEVGSPPAALISNTKANTVPQAAFHESASCILDFFSLANNK